MPKRKASFAFPYERPSKLSKRTTSSSVGSLTKTGTVSKKTFEPVLLTTTEVSPASPLGDTAPVPSLRRASTLTLAEESDSGSVTKRTSSRGRPASLSKKSSSFVEEGVLVSTLSKTKSGSIVGETTLAVGDGPAGTLSRKSSSVRSSKELKVPSVPSGLTKLALSLTGAKGSLHVSKSALIDNVDETEISSALASLRSTQSSSSALKDTPSLSKTASKASLSKSASNISLSKASSKASLTKEASKASLSKEKSKADEDMETSEDTENAKDDDEEVAGPSDEDVAAPGVMLPPGGLIEIAISFDTTGSMYGCLAEVRAKVQDLVQRLQADIPGIRIAVIAHGDYCDERTYVVKWIDFNSTLPELCDFVNNVQRTGGGDGPECYELVLQRAREVLSWTPGSQRVLIMIGDDEPHEPGYTYNGKTYHIDWREECGQLRDMGVRIYGVCAGSRGEKFSKEISRMTGGIDVELKNFQSIFDMLMMICYREGNPDMLPIYAEEMRARPKGAAADVTALTKTFAMAPMAPTKATPAKRAKKITTAAAKPRAKAAKATPKKTHVKSPKAAIIKKAAVAKVAKSKKRKAKTLVRDKVQKRENVPDSSLCKGPLKNFVWTKWVCLILPKPAAGKQKEKYITGSKFLGARAKNIFNDDSRKPAIYEFALQGPGSNARKKYVMYYRKSVGFDKVIRWDAYMLRHKLVKQEVDRALKLGFTVMVRRATSKAKNITIQKKQMIKAHKYLDVTFDYAWKKYIWRKGPSDMKHRQVTVKRRGAKPLEISTNSI